ncbi:MAG TPA: hypothetical protein VLJ37_08045 [bacterium]|nr:hypothetical protein [bacterium]
MDKADPEDKKGKEAGKSGKEIRCLMCGKPGPETICQHCKTLVQAEALEKKRKAEKTKE